MLPAAVLSVIVEVRQVNQARSALSSVNSELAKVEGTTTRVGNSMVSMGSKAEKVGRGMTKYLAVPILAVGTASAVMAAKFNRSMNLIATDAGGSKKEVASLSKEVLKLSEHSEFGPQKLADALFFIESAGVRGGKAIKDLNEIQKAAMAGNADLEHAVFGTVGAMNALGKEGKNIEKILAIMNATVGHGHLRLEELTQAMSTGTLGAAKTFGIDMEGFGSALAFFTRMSEPAQQAATRLRQTITHLASSSTNKGTEALESIGLNIDHMSEKIKKTRALGPVIQELAQHLKGISEAEKNQVLTDAFGGGRYGTQIREAIANVHLLLKTEKEVAETSTVARLHRSEKLQEESAAVKMKIAWSQVQASMIKLGEVILPIVVPMLQKAADAVVTLASWFGHLSSGTQHWIVYVSAAIVVASLLLRVFGGFIKSLGEIVVWFGSAIDATAAQTVANEELAVSYQAVAASAAEARAAAITQYGPYAGGIYADKMGATEASTVASKVPGMGMAGSMMSGLKSALPMAAAAYGIGNIITSVTNKDWQDAGAEGAGAMIGGLAAVLTGNPELAGVGIGVGSLVGELASHAFNDMFGGETENLAEAARKRVMERYGGAEHHTMKQARTASHTLIASSKTIRSTQRQDKKVNQEVTVSNKHLNAVREQYGSASRQAAKAEHELWREKERGLAADRSMQHAEKVHGELRTASMRADRAAIAAAKQLIEVKSQDMKDSFQKLGQVQKEPPSAARLEKEHKWLKRIKDDHEAVTKAKKEETETIRQATTQIGPKFAKQLESLNPALSQAKERAREAGESYKDYAAKIQQGAHQLTPGIKSLKQIADEFTGSRTKAESFGSTMAGPFTSKTHGAFFQTAKNATKWREQVGSALSDTQTEAVGMIEAWGGTAPSGAKEAGKHKEAVKKARGGHLPGNRSGDRVPLLAEDGEYILNKNAVAVAGRQNLDRLNFGLAPRFAEGGAVEKAMMEARQIAGTPYVWGGGHSSFSAAGGLDCSGAVSDVLHAAGLLGRPMTSGMLMGWGKPGAGAITVHANPTHAWMEIAGHPYGTSVDDSSHGLGFYGKPPASYAHEFVTRHAGTLEGFTGSALKERGLKGSGHFAKLGNEQIHHTTKQMNAYIQKHMPGRFGGGDANVAEGLTGTIPHMAAEAVTKAHASMRPALALFEALWAESSMGESAPGNVLQALEPYTKVRPAAQEISGFLTGSPPWTGTSAMQVARENPGMPAYEIAQAVQASGAGEASHGASNYGTQRGPALASMRANGLKFSEGGLAGKAGREALIAKHKHSANHKEQAAVTKPVKELHKVQSSLKKAVHQVRHGHVPKGYSGIRKAVRQLGKVEGLSPKMIKSLVEGSENVATYSEYAQNAGGLNILEEEPFEAPEDWFAKTLFGQFQGHDEGFWLVSELESLGGLRNSLLNAKSNIQGPQRTIREMVKRFKKALHEAEKKVREMKQKQKEIEKDEEAIEKAEKLGLHKLEQEKNDWEHKLDQLKNAKNPDKGAIQNAQSQIKIVNDAIHGTQKSGADGIKSDQEKLKDVKKQLNAREKEVTAYTNFVPQLEEKRTTIDETAMGLVSGYSMADGPFKGKSWEGLQEIQGHVKDWAKVANLSHDPEGRFGGNILGVQESLKAYEEINKPPAHGAKKPEESASAIELKQLEKEIETIKLQREMIQQIQGPLLESFPSVSAIAAPYAGSFAMGGMVAATVGERGKEIAVMPSGTQMLSHYDAKEAVSSAGPTHLNFEHLEFHEAEQRVKGRVNGEDFEQEIKQVNRKQVRRSLSRTPGGKE